MTDGELSWVWKLIDMVTGPKALLVSIISLIFLTPLDFASERQLRVFGVYPLVHPIRPWVTLALWLAISVLLAVFVRWSLSQIQIMAVAFGQRRGMRKYLVEGMPNDQLKIIHDHVHQRKGSLPRSIHSGAIRDLEKRGFVYQAGDTLSPINTYPFALTRNGEKLLRPHAFQKIMDERNRLEAKRLR